MVTKLLSASAVLAVAGAASAASFRVNLIDAGGVPGGTLGAPITWTGGASFNPPAGGNTPPTAGAIFGNALLEWDSYVALDPVGRSRPASSSTATDGYSALGPTNIIFPNATPTTVFGPSSLSGVWFNAALGGGFVTSGAGDRLFIAQITLRPGSSAPTTTGLLANLKDSGTVNPDGELGALRFGLANATNNNGKWAQSYYLDFVSRPVSGVNSTFNGGTSYEIYIVAVPTPGAAGLAAIAGLVALRRRR